MKERIALKRGYRTPFVKKDAEFARLNTVDLSCLLVNDILKKIDFNASLIQHVVWGMVVPDANIYSVAREVVLGSELDNRVEAYSVSRACATSLQATTNAVSFYHSFPEEKSISLVGGVESFSSVRPVLTDQASNYFKSLAVRAGFGTKLLNALKIPITRLFPVPPAAREYSTGLTMGEHCELMVKEFKIERKRQDAFALASHQNAVKAREVIEPQIVDVLGVKKDTLIRDTTSMEALSGLRPAFDSKTGSVTAGNASPYTDGAAALFVISPALESEVKPDAFMSDFEYVGFNPADGLLMGPGKAMLRILQRQNLRWNDLDYIEVHEAFAGQVLCNVEAVNSSDYRTNQYGVSYDAGKLDELTINPYGSSISYGHPFGATGARMVSQAIAYLEKNNKSRALVSACTAGGLAGACLITREG